MADEQYGYDDEDTQEQETASSLRQKLKEANARAKAADTLTAENESLKQQIAVSSAGLSLTEVQSKALLAVHSGDLNPEGLKATAQSLGFIAAPPPVQDDPSLAVHAQIAASAAGAEPQSTDKDAEVDARLRKATSQTEVMAIYAESGRPIAQ